MANTTETRPDDWPSFAVSGDKTRPVPDSAIATGFPQTTTPPTRQEFNWCFNQVFKGVRYLLQRGVPDWSANETYLAQAVVIRGGLSYTALSGSTNLDPATNPGTWERWGFSATQQAAAITASINSALTPYSTTAQMNTAISSALGPYSTTSQMNSAISAAVAPYITSAAAGSMMDAKILTQQSVQDLRTQSAIQAQLTLGNNLRAKSSRFALAVNDLVYMTNQGIAFTVATTSWVTPGGATTGGGNAGSALIAETSITAPTGAIINDVKNAMWVNPVDQSVFAIALSSGTTNTLTKYTAAGAVVLSVAIDTGASPGGAFSIIQLSNGNLAVFWAWGINNQFFAVFNLDLQQVVAKTALTGPAIAAGTNWVLPIALTGGGFAVSISPGANATVAATFFGIYSNAGAAVLAMAAIAGTSALLDAQARPTEASNGNIIIGITSNTAANGLAVAIFTPAGAVVRAYSVIDTSQGDSGGRMLESSVLPGFMAIGFTATAGTGRINVIDNTGAVQGTVLALTNITGTDQASYRIRNDGTNFWAVYFAGGPAVVTVRFGVTGGASAITSSNTATGMDNLFDCFLERDFIVFAFSNKIFVLFIRADGTTGVFNIGTAATTLAAAGAGTNVTFRAVGDFCMLAYSNANGTIASKFRIWRYIDVALMGVCQTAVAAGNPNTLITISTGPVALSTNALTGPGIRPFDHSGGLVAGNKGSLLQNSAVLKGF